MIKPIITISLLSLLIVAQAEAGSVDNAVSDPNPKWKEYKAGDVLLADDLNKHFDSVANAINDNDARISANAQNLAKTSVEKDMLPPGVTSTVYSEYFSQVGSWTIRVLLSGCQGASFAYYTNSPTAHSETTNGEVANVAPCVPGSTCPAISTRSVPAATLISSHYNIDLWGATANLGGLNQVSFTRIGDDAGDTCNEPLKVYGFWLDDPANGGGPFIPVQR